jgi:solute carrier family 66, member 2
MHLRLVTSSYTPVISYSQIFPAHKIMNLDIYLIVQYVWAFFLAIGPILGYIPQYIDIKRTRHYQGFSSAICFILLTSNILRILSYVLRPFDIFLLAQSIFMVIVQLLMLHLIVKLAGREIFPSSSTDQRSFGVASSDKRSVFSSFWAWNSFFDYFLFLIFFTLFFTSIVLVVKFFFPSELFETGFLFISTLIESTLCMPQAVTNWRNKSTSGLNKSLVTSWIAGDVFKLCYYIYSTAPYPFTVCAIIQILVDFVITSQIVYYEWFHRTARNRDISRASSTIPFKEDENLKVKVNFIKQDIVK